MAREGRTMGAERTSSEQEAEEEPRENEPLIGAKQQGDLKLAETHISIAPDGADSARFAFLSDPRPWRDTVFSYLFVGTVLITYVFGFFAVKNADWDQQLQLRLARYNPDSGQCEAIHHAYVGNTPTHVALIHGRKASEEAANPSIVKVALALILSTVVLILPVGLATLWVLYRYTREVIFAIFALMCTIPVTAGVILSTVCLTSKTGCSPSTIINIPLVAQSGVSFLIIISVTAIPFVIMWFKRKPFDLTIQILKAALQALKQNLSLLLLNPVMSVGMWVVVGPIGVFIVCAYFNGKVAPDFDAIKNSFNRCSQATGAPCCQFKRAEWVTPYVALAYFALFWVIFLSYQLQILVISGTISQWYFAPTGSSKVGTTKRSMRNAFGPSFGTACFSSLTLAIAMILKNLMQIVGAENTQGFVSVFLRACFSWLFQIFEFFTRFATNFAAISGDDFCTSSRATYDLLKRNLLSTLVVEVMVQYVLSGMLIMISLANALVAFGVMYYFTTADMLGTVMAAQMCFFFSIVGLSQIYSPLSIVIDTVYICYAMDKDVGAVSKREVHDIYMLLPPASPGDKTMLAVQRSQP